MTFERGEAAEQGPISLTADTVNATIGTLQMQGIPVERKVLHEILSGFLEGSDWVLQKFSWPDRPPVRVVSFGDNTGTKAAFYSTLDKSVSINAAALSFYQGSTLVPGEVGIAFPGIPENEHPAVSVRQFYEMVGVQETVHYLQDHGAQDLTHMKNHQPLSPDEGLLAYWSQPLKQEALHQAGRFFMEKYGNNPFAAVEASLSFNPPRK